MEIPKLEIIPFGEALDKVLSVGLFLGHLVTKHHRTESPFIEVTPENVDRLLPPEA